MGHQVMNLLLQDGAAVAAVTHGPRQGPLLTAQ
ncbi:hypothetical protein H4W80_005741 [Nonomuraea angiospora]|uniref:Uncharacterized protein n=1 Tax=Nonomuraea angiospora TaxID=46172 RepID=A0ABR9M3M5_9ACTN|nr:hypothetical protein [Nonomuraea angiospora]